MAAVDSILVVCTGNICRSPAGERLLAAALPGIRVGSAGLGAVVGAAADPETAAAAAERGLDLAGHVARQFTAALARDHALILVMEPGQRDEIRRLYPQFSGRTMMFDQWTGGGGIADPHGRPRDAHRRALAAIAEAADAWVARLGGKARNAAEE
ncbi:arsenate reductase/protein-tyrosine-phosphatase family protein [Acidimangrovimonas pyrenivorans]|uniref:protein-tyrosine-phosphatase n=1 Tax=Acidimangrovimonas pyrenivorans TaxID=2030798 RepID=A0ABV7AI14_9RHOB